MSSQPSPLLIFETLNAYQRTDALKAGIELHLFTAIADGAISTPEIAAKCGASEKGIRVLCDFLTIIGLWVKEIADVKSEFGKLNSWFVSDHKLRVALRQRQHDVRHLRARTRDGSGVTCGDIAREFLCLLTEGFERRTSRERLRGGHGALLS